MKILHIVGARPQFMKLYPLYLEFHRQGVERQVILHTGQHYDHLMSDIFTVEFGLPKPDYNLNINGLSHGAMTGRMIEEIEKILLYESPTCVIVYGDTNSTLAGALAAKKLEYKIAHVESGIRFENQYMPEEINRVLVDRISDILFCPTSVAIQNLIDEGFDKFNEKLFLETGDLMFDCFILATKELKDHKNDNETILVTCHRQENTNPKTLKKLLFELELLQIKTKKKILFTVHPRTQKIIDSLNIKTSIHLAPPMGYNEFIRTLKSSFMLISDSGGAIRESFFAQKPSIFLLDQHIWKELQGTRTSLPHCVNDASLIMTFDQLFSKKDEWNFQSKIFGNGNSRELIVASLLNYIKQPNEAPHN